MNRLKLSFPPKIAALIIVILIVPVVVVINLWIARGTVTFTSSVPGAHIVETEQEVKYELPATLQRRTGRHMITFAAPGYVSQERRVLFPPFRLMRTEDFSLEKAVYNEENAESFKKVPLSSVLPHIENNVFAIEFPDESGVYLISLRPNPNWFASDPEYQAALINAKKKALSWIEGQKQDPQQLKIEWVPYDPEARK